MSRFNLIDETWIPVRFCDGRREELGIRETLLRSREIAEIEHDSPLVVASLHRFLLAVLYRALEGPTDIEQAKRCFREGLPIEKIDRYLEKWRDRFWLFHEKYPFGQIPTFQPTKWRAWTVLAAERNADNAKILFDHIDVDAAGSIMVSAASRWILATQTFSLSSGKSELSHTLNAPSATAAMVIPIGRTLQDTLLFLLIPQNREISITDLPLWERVPESVTELRSGPERAVAGFADLYTWRSRAIILEPDSSGLVCRLGFASGLKNASFEQDPMLSYRIDKENGKLPIQFRERGIWRDFDSLLPDQSGIAPKVMENATILAKLDVSRRPRSVLVLGQANDKAKIENWRMERFALPESLVGDHCIRTEIREILSLAEDSQKSLWIACGHYARNLLSRGNRDPSGEDIRNFVEQLSVSAFYWSVLEVRFHEILSDYSLRKDPDDIRYFWLKCVRAALSNAWAQHQASVCMNDAWAIRALVKSERPVICKLKELDREIEKFDPLRTAA